jgi:hypothetical protein
MAERRTLIDGLKNPPPPVAPQMEKAWLMSGDRCPSMQDVFQGE